MSRHYIDYSARIYGIYLKYLAPEDIHVYSVDEAFFDGGPYRTLYGPDIRDLTRAIQADVKSSTGITSTCGMGTNLYLAKIAMDMLAKKSPSFRALLTEETYRQRLGDHRPLSDFWMIGRGTERRLNACGIYTMADIRRTDPKRLFSLLGRNADYLIDHAFGREPTTMADIKSYRSPVHSLSSNQVLLRDYSYEEGLVVLKEMTDLLSLDLTDQDLLTDQVVLFVGYSETGDGRVRAYLDLPEGRLDRPLFPPDGKPYVSGSAALPAATDARRLLTQALTDIYRKRVLPGLYIRRIGIAFENVRPASLVQLSLFLDRETAEKDHILQTDVNALKKRFGKNSMLKALDLLDCATTQERNGQIGGHRA